MQDIWILTDYGSTWNKKMYDKSRDWQSITSNYNGRILAAVEDGGSIWISTDYGDS